jgi:hypothetical protein
MNISESERLVVPCHFRADGVFCQEGYLFYSQAQPKDGVDYFQRVMVEGEPVSCSACEGKGVIPTERGKEFLTFFDTFLRAKIHETCADYLDDKMGFSS